MTNSFFPGLGIHEIIFYVLWVVLLEKSLTAGDRPLKFFRLCVISHFGYLLKSVDKDSVFHLWWQNFVCIISVHIITHEKKSVRYLTQNVYSSNAKFGNFSAFINLFWFLLFRENTFCAHRLKGYFLCLTLIAKKLSQRWEANFYQKIFCFLHLTKILYSV